MKNNRFPVAALVVVGMLNLLGFLFLAGHPERVPAAYVPAYPGGSNAPVQLPGWIGRMP
jgi:hypothetical protein